MIGTFFIGDAFSLGMRWINVTSLGMDSRKIVHEGLARNELAGI